MSIFDTIESAVLSRQPTYPPKQSAGGTNTYTVKGCAVVGHTPGYCVCLNKIMAFERDGALTSYSECEKAISNRTCRALDMRKEEQVAGKALYYIDRALLREEMDKAFADSTPRFTPSKAAPIVRPERIAPVAPKPIVKPVEPNYMPEDGYAAAINVAIKEAQQPVPAPAPIPEPKVASPSPSSVNKGLSMIEKARLQMGLNKE